MNDFNDETAKAVFDRVMLNTLLVEFLRETNIPFVVVHNSKFKAIFHYVCPSIQLPTHQDLIKLNVNNYVTFKNWEKVSNSAVLNDERITRVEEWAKEEIQRGRNPTAQKEQSFAELLQIDLASGTSSVRGFQGEDNSLWKLPDQQGNIHVQYSGENGEIQYEMEPEPEFRTENDDYEMGLEMMMEQINEPYQEEKPNLDNLGHFNYRQPCSSSEEDEELRRLCVEGSTSIEREIKQEYDDYEERKPSEESLRMDGPEQAPPLVQQNEQVLQEVKIEEEEAEEEGEEEEKNNSQRSSPALVLTVAPGVVRWPCIVCSQQKESSKVRAVAKVDAFFMIYVCTQFGQYSMGHGKELARMRQFKCCVDHLSDMYDKAMRFLNIVEPKRDIFPESRKIIDLYHAIKKLRDPSYDQKGLFDISRKNMWPFVNSLRRFFETYGRHNYLPKPGEPESYLAIQKTDLTPSRRSKRLHGPS